MVVDFLDMVENIVACSNINLTIVRDRKTEMEGFDLGVRQALLDSGEEERFIDMVYQLDQDGQIYYVTDYFETEYCVLRVPEEEAQYGDFLIMGPYRDMHLNDVRLNELMEVKLVPMDYANELREYYNAVPVVGDLGQWREVCVSMARMLYGNMQIQARYVKQTSIESRFKQEPTEDELSFKMIEQRYAIEAGLMKAISSGNTEEALTLLNNISQFKLSARYKDSVRNIRNGLITFNTLARKSAEVGGVHPAHIDSLSAQLAKRVETINSVREATKLKGEMVRKYCLLVRNYSLRGRSPVIQKVVNHINLNLTQDLSLKRLSAEYSVNASYLSALFKKEMGVTLTDYISQQRIRRAITLLNSSNLQIQDVASESGIYDVNYFRKLFKKVTGKTPTEYAKQVRGYGHIENT